MHKIKLCLGVQRSMEKVGWRSLDVKGAPDIRDNIEYLRKIKNRSCQTIIASAVLEHGEFQGRGEERMEKTISILTLWRSKLCRGGILYISVPDFDMVIDALIAYRHRYWAMRNTKYEDILGLIYGTSRRRFTWHRMAYNVTALSYALEEAGFINIRRMGDSEDAKFLPEYNPSSRGPRILRVEARNET